MRCQCDGGWCCYLFGNSLIFRVRHCRSPIRRITRPSLTPSCPPVLAAPKNLLHQNHFTSRSHLSNVVQPWDDSRRSGRRWCSVSTSHAYGLRSVRFTVALPPYQHQPARWPLRGGRSLQQRCFWASLPPRRIAIAGPGLSGSRGALLRKRLPPTIAKLPQSRNSSARFLDSIAYK